MAKAKKEKKGTKIKKVNPHFWEYGDEIIFAEVRDPLFVSPVAGLFEEFMTRSKEKEEGYTAREYLHLVIRALAVEDPSIRLFVIANKKTGVYIGFCTLIFSQGPPKRAWLEKMHISSKCPSVEMAGAFQDFIFEWCRELKLPHIHVMTKFKSISKALTKRKGFEARYVVLRKIL